MNETKQSTFEQLEDEIRIHYWREVRLTAEDLAARHLDGELPTVADVVDEARARAADHPWIHHAERAQFVLWCSEHPDAATRSGERAISGAGTIDWSLLARKAFLEDVLDSLVSHAKLDLAPTFRCADCSGRGYAVLNEETAPEIQRCDSCQQYATDDDARAAADPLASGKCV